jgi:hypothetical protein
MERSLEYNIKLVVKEIETKDVEEMWVKKTKMEGVRYIWNL